METDRDFEALRGVPDPFADDRVAELAPKVMPRSPTRADVRRLRLLAAIGALVYEGGLLAMMGVRSDLSGVARTAIVATITLPLLAAALALGAALRAQVAAGAGARTAAFFGLPVALFGASALVPRAGVAVGSLLASTAACLMGTTLLAVGPLVLAAFAYRHAFATAARWRTMALGLSCGALAASAIELRCTATGIAHVVFGHGPILAISALVGMALARVTRA